MYVVRLLQIIYDCYLEFPKIIYNLQNNEMQMQYQFLNCPAFLMLEIDKLFYIVNYYNCKYKL